MQVTALEAIAQLLSTTGAPVPPAGEGKAAFAERFARELARLEHMDREPGAWEAESLLSALGAAAVEEFELACAFIDAAHNPPVAAARRDARRPTFSAAALRRRFALFCA